jgi:uncharacterized protein
MKKRYTITIALLLLMLLNSCEKEEIFGGTTESFSLQSNSNGATYNIKVALPANYNPANQKYPTIYVLDGDENFDLVANKCDELANKYATSNVLVVSIGYGNDRSIDYTPAIDGTDSGAHQFLNFIETQLIPKMEQDFSAATNRESRVILGHSYGGLLGAYAFCVRNELFGNYILLSPSLWHDKLTVLKLEKANRDSNKLNQQLVFMGIGETENSGRMQAPFEAFYKNLYEDYPNIKIEKNREYNLDHMGSKNINIRKGLDYYFLNRY